MRETDMPIFSGPLDVTFILTRYSLPCNKCIVCLFIFFVPVRETALS